jgi:DNA primase
MREEIKNHWLIHPLRPGYPTSLRALNPKGSVKNLYPRNLTYHPDDFGSEEELKCRFEADALRLSAEGYNVYVVMNQIRADFHSHQAVRDADITHRLRLLIDIDRLHGTDEPASDAEIEAADDLSTRVRDGLAHWGIGDVTKVHSGNGVHLYVPLDPVPNSESATTTIEVLLKRLNEHFKSEVVGIDTSVYNASRITKVVGTLARKGLESPGRPYRMARLA